MQCELCEYTIQPSNSLTKEQRKERFGNIAMYEMKDILERKFIYLFFLFEIFYIFLIFGFPLI